MDGNFFKAEGVDELQESQKHLQKEKEKFEEKLADIKVIKLEDIP